MTHKISNPFLNDMALHFLEHNNTKLNIRSIILSTLSHLISNGFVPTKILHGTSKIKKFSLDFSLNKIFQNQNLQF